MEVFVYLVMGGEKSKIELRPLASSDDSQEALIARFRAFNAAVSRSQNVS